MSVSALWSVALLLPIVGHADSLTGCAGDATAHTFSAPVPYSYCYKTNTTAMLWTAAQAFCVSEGGWLVSIATQEENDYVTRLTNNMQTWIGLRDVSDSDNASDSFRWVWQGGPLNGSVATYVSWAPGQPDDPKQKWVYINFNTTGRWDNTEDSAAVDFRSFVCQFYNTLTPPPTSSPSFSPTSSPTHSPTSTPTDSPTSKPTHSPTSIPTPAPPSSPSSPAPSVPSTPSRYQNLPTLCTQYYELSNFFNSKLSRSGSEPFSFGAQDMLDSSVREALTNAMYTIQQESYSSSYPPCGGVGEAGRSANCVSATLVSPVPDQLCSKFIDRSKMISNDACSFQTRTDQSCDCKTNSISYKYGCYAGGQAVDLAFCGKAYSSTNKSECTEGSCPTWYTSDWSTCSNGNRQREVSCYVGNGGPYSLTNCESVFGVIGPPNESPCTSYLNVTWQSNEWVCLASNATSFATKQKAYRIVFCVDTSSQLILSDKWCKNNVGVRPVQIDECNGAGSYNDSIVSFSVGPWSTCSSTCGVGNQTRSVKCMAVRDSNLELPTSECLTANLTKPNNIRRCNDFTCPDPFWSVGPWSVCSKSSGSGVRSRSVVCMLYNRGTHLSTLAASASDCAAMMMPVQQEACNVQSSDFCAKTDCSGHGSCESGACVCTSGYYGQYCESEQCTVGRDFATGECCDKEMDMNGRCCEGSLDSNGVCCRGIVDACGQCNSTGVGLDTNGNCCSDTLDSEGQCCILDEMSVCGVCYQSESSCMTNVVFETSWTTTNVQDLTNALSSYSIDTDHEVKNHNFQNKLSRTRDGALGQTVPTTTLISLNLSQEAAYQLLLKLSPTFELLVNGQSINLTLMELSASPVCGNGVCEVGETCVPFVATAGCCQADCPSEKFKACPVDENDNMCGSKGTCLLNTGVCSCHQGYGGSDCSDCSTGYFASGSKCLPVLTTRDCRVSDWYDTSPCTATCAMPGNKTQSRDITVPVSGAGTACPALTRIIECVNPRCSTFNSSLCKLFPYVTLPPQQPSIAQHSYVVGVSGLFPVQPSDSSVVCELSLLNSSVVQSWIAFFLSAEFYDPISRYSTVSGAVIYISKTGSGVTFHLSFYLVSMDSSKSQQDAMISAIKATAQSMGGPLQVALEVLGIKSLTTTVTVSEPKISTPSTPARSGVFSEPRGSKLLILLIALLMGLLLCILFVCLTFLERREKKRKKAILVNPNTSEETSRPHVLTSSYLEWSSSSPKKSNRPVKVTKSAIVDTSEHDNVNEEPVTHPLSTRLKEGAKLLLEQITPNVMSNRYKPISSFYEPANWTDLNGLQNRRNESAQGDAYRLDSGFFTSKPASPDSESGARVKILNEQYALLSDGRLIFKDSSGDLHQGELVNVGFRTCFRPINQVPTPLIGLDCEALRRDLSSVSGASRPDTKEGSGIDFDAMLRNEKYKVLSDGRVVYSGETEVPKLHATGTSESRSRGQGNADNRISAFLRTQSQQSQIKIFNQQYALLCNGRIIFKDSEHKLHEGELYSVGGPVRFRPINQNPLVPLQRVDLEKLRRVLHPVGGVPEQISFDAILHELPPIDGEGDFLLGEENISVRIVNDQYAILSNGRIIFMDSDMNIHEGELYTVGGKTLFRPLSQRPVPLTTAGVDYEALRSALRSVSGPNRPDVDEGRGVDLNVMLTSEKFLVLSNGGLVHQGGTEELKSHVGGTFEGNSPVQAGADNRSNLDSKPLPPALPPRSRSAPNVPVGVKVFYGQYAILANGRLLFKDSVGELHEGELFKVRDRRRFRPINQEPPAPLREVEYDALRKCLRPVSGANRFAAGPEIDIDAMFKDLRTTDELEILVGSELVGVQILNEQYAVFNNGRFLFIDSNMDIHEGELYTIGDKSLFRSLGERPAPLTTKGVDYEAVRKGLRPVSGASRPDTYEGREFDFDAMLSKQQYTVLSHGRPVYGCEARDYSLNTDCVAEPMSTHPAFPSSSETDGTKELWLTGSSDYSVLG